MIDILTQKYDRKLLIYFSILAVLGTIMLYSASWYESFANSNGQTDMLFLQNHLKRLLLGIICLFIFLILDYRHLKNVAIYMIIGSIFLLLLTKISYLAKGLGWSKPARWIYFGPFSIQTSDIARMSVLVYMAYYVDKKREKLHDFYTGFFPAVCLLAIIMALIVIQPDFSTAAMIGALGTIILFIGGVKISQLSLISTSGLLIGIPVLLSREYRRQRVLSWFGFADLPDVGYQAKQSLISLGNGGILGAVGYDSALCSDSGLDWVDGHVRRVLSEGTLSYVIDASRLTLDRGEVGLSARTD